MASSLLPAIVLAALALRLWGLGFGLPAINDTDELIFELCSVKMLREGTLNPGWFGHPATTTLYVLAVVNVTVFGAGHLAGLFPSVQAFGDAIYLDPGWVVLPGRAAMAVFGTGCIYLTYRLGSALFDRRAGLLGAALLAVSPVHVAYSQVIRSDIMATVFMLLMLLATVRFAREPRPRHLLMAAVWFGLTTTTKWPFAACAAGFAGVVLQQAWHGQLRWRKAVVCLGGFGVAGVLTILMVSPYLVLDYQTALKSVMGEAQLRHVGATGKDALWNAWWYLRGPLLDGLGPAGMALAAVGLTITARHREARALLFPPMILLAVVTVTQNLIWVRWVLPFLPILSMLAAAAAIALHDRLPRREPLMRAGLALAAIAVIFVPLLHDLRSRTVERINDTRQAATRWASAHLPRDSRVMVEHFGFDLLAQPWSYLFPLADAGCVDARAFLDGKVQYAAINALRGGHHNVDYGTLTPSMRSTCDATHAIISQYDRYLAEEAMFPKEMANYRELLARSTLLATIRPEAGRMGGPTIRIVRIDRPYPHAQALGKVSGQGGEAALRPDIHSNTSAEADK